MVFGDIVQLVERMLCTHEVTGSSPVISIITGKFNKKPSLMKARILKDKKKRKLVCKYERKRLVFKSIVRDEKLPDMVRWKASLKLARLPKSSSKVRIRNRCVVTGRPRGVYRHSRISRVVLRDFASMGSMNGVSKSSW